LLDFVANSNETRIHEEEVMAEPQVHKQQETQQEATTMQRAEPQKTEGQLERTPRGGALGKSEWASPFSVMRRFMDEIDQLFSSFGFGVPSTLAPRLLERAAGPIWSPTIETLTRDNRFVFRVDLPGLRRDDVKVEIAENELVISGQRTQDEREVKGGTVYSERRYGSFERRIMLPEGCNLEDVEAVFENGVLEVSLPTPKRASPSSRTIEVKHGHKAESEQGGAESIH
jgi:HSP20 family protein